MTSLVTSFKSFRLSIPFGANCHPSSRGSKTPNPPLSAGWPPFRRNTLAKPRPLRLNREAHSSPHWNVCVSPQSTVYASNSITARTAVLAPPI